jgi:hypothetical protein
MRRVRSPRQHFAAYEQHDLWLIEKFGNKDVDFLGGGAFE